MVRSQLKKGAPTPQYGNQFTFHPSGGQMFGYQPPTPKRSWGKGIALVLAAVAVIGAVGGYQWYTTHRPEAIVLVAAPAPQEKAFCLDASGSVDADGHLSKVAAKAFTSSIGQLNGWQNVVPTDKPVEAIPQLNLQVRVIRADSYSTRTAAAYAEQYSIPASGGISIAKPLSTDGTYKSWQAAYDQVTLDQQAARQAQEDATASIKQLLKARSDGSDITGCVAASLDAAPVGATTNILIVSDLQDNALTTSSGGPREFTGDYSTARLSIVQACPSGVAATCEKDATNFVARMANLGVPESSITIVRPEQLNRAIDTWLAEA